MNSSRQLPLGAKVRDYWWTVFFTDPLALPFVRLFSRRKWFTPDQISIVAILLGLSVGPVFALGTRAGFVAGGILFYVAFFVDCIDGKLARALGITSPKGATLDRIGDGGRRASASIGLIVGMYRYEGLDPETFMWAVAYVIGAYYFWEMSGVETPIIKTTRPVAVAEGTAAEGMKGGLGARWSEALARHRLLPTPGMPDVQAVVFIVGPITGLLVPALALGLAMVGAGLAVSLIRRLR